MDKTDFDKIFEETHLKSEEEYIERLINVIKQDDDEKRDARYRREREKMLSEFYAYRCVKIGETTYDDYYFERLHTHYKECKSNYEYPIKNLIKLKLSIAKQEAKQASKNLNKKLLSLNEINTVKYLAQYCALDKILSKTFAFYFEQNESIESIENRLKGTFISGPESKEEIPEEASINDSEQSRNFKKEFTTSRQILAIHYLFEFANIKNCDQTEKARFVRFLIGKELGNTKIENTTIYKKVRSPLKTTDSEMKKDLRYVKEFFKKLNHQDIVNAITKEIDK